MCIIEKLLNSSHGLAGGLFHKLSEKLINREAIWEGDVGN